MNSGNAALPGKLLEGLGMNLHDGSGLFIIEKRLRRPGLCSRWFASGIRDRRVCNEALINALAGNGHRDPVAEIAPVSMVRLRLT